MLFGLGQVGTERARPLVPLQQLEVRFWGQKYLELVLEGVLGGSEGVKARRECQKKKLLRTCQMYARSRLRRDVQKNCPSSTTGVRRTSF